MNTFVNSIFTFKQKNQYRKHNYNKCSLYTVSFIILNINPYAKENPCSYQTRQKKSEINKAEFQNS